MVPISLASLRTPRLTARVLLVLLLSVVAIGAAAPAALAQTSSGGSDSLILPPQTKEEAKAAAEAARSSNTSTNTTDDGSGSVLLILIIGGLLVIVAAGVYVLRDASSATGDRGSRRAPERAVENDGVGRGAPRTMFASDTEVGGKHGRTKKRQQGKRQKAARRRNR